MRYKRDNSDKNGTTFLDLTHPQGGLGWARKREKQWPKYLQYFQESLLLLFFGEEQAEKERENKRKCPRPIKLKEDLFVLSKRNKAVEWGKFQLSQLSNFLWPFIPSLNIDELLRFLSVIPLALIDQYCFGIIVIGIT